MERVRAWMATGSRADRIAVAFGLLVVGLVAVGGRSPRVDGGDGGLDAGAVVLLVVAGAGLALRRRAPLLVALAELALSAVWYSRYESRLIDAPTIVAFYAVGLTGDRLRQYAIVAVAVAALAAGVAADDGTRTDIVVAGTGYSVAAILFGELVGGRRRLLDRYTARAERAEADRDAEAERRVAEERLRIARDVHDVLAHTVAVMTVQAGVAADALADDPDAARAALRRVRAAGRQATTEVRTTVGLLRGDPGGDAPVAGLAGLAELVASPGAEVEVELDDGLDAADRAGVDALVGLTVYRVVQEALTNVARHAGARRATVRLRRAGPDVEVTVADDGPGTPGASDAGDRGPAGFGLQGMRERVEAVGGRLRYGPRPGGGWSVEATLPGRAGDR